MKEIQGIIFTHRPATVDLPHGIWYSPNHVARWCSATHMWTVSTHAGSFIAEFPTIQRAQAIMADLERIAERRAAT